MKARTLIACFGLACSLMSENAVDAGAPPAPAEPVPIVLLRRSAKHPPNGSNADVLVPANLTTDTVARRVAQVMSDLSGYGQFVLRLDRYARKYLLDDPSTSEARRTTLSEPAYLFLSDRQGGFPASSFWLDQSDGSLREMREVTFVDMIVNDRDLVPGLIDGLEQIYAHELGHLIVAALAGESPRRASNAVHFITVRTDAWTAFNEGWGEHFQPMGLDHAAGSSPDAARGMDAPATERFWYDRFAHEQVDGCVICPANLRFLRWQGRGEQRMRDGPLRANHFAYEVAMPASLAGGGRPPFEARMYRDVVPPAPGGELKNPSAMMESEGVVATFFYRMASDDRLRNSYRDVGFYQAFIPPERADDLRRSGPTAVILPSENVYLKIFDVLHRGFRWGDWPLIAFVAAYAGRFPEDAAALYDVFLNVTRGVTVDPSAHARHLEPIYLQALKARLVAGTITPGAALPRPIWMTSPGMTFGFGVFRYLRLPTSFTFDLNAADTADLRSVPHVTSVLAGAIVRARDARGGFVRVDDLATIAGMSADLLTQFRAMAARMEQRVSESQPTGGGPGLLDRLLVPMLRASYYAAGVWQFGKALALAGAAFSLTAWGIGRLFPASLGGRLPAGRPRWRRAMRALGRGLLAATVPCAVSVAIYATGVLPGPAIMAGLGLLLGALLIVAALAAGRLAPTNTYDIARLVVAMVVASAIMGAMY